MVLLEVTGVKTQKLAISGKLRVKDVADKIKAGSNKDSLFFFVGEGKQKKMANCASRLQELSDQFKSGDGYLRIDVQKAESF